MKRLLAILIVCVWVTPTMAEQNTLFKRTGNITGYGALLLKYTTLQGKDVRALGVRGGWTFDHKFTIGGGFNFLVTDINDPEIPDTIRDTDFGWGGIEAEWVFSSDSLFHITLYGMVGGGSLRVRQPDTKSAQTDLVGVGTLAANLELNLVEHARLTIGVGYREVQRVNTPGWTNGDFRGPEGTITLKLGKF
jgi:hypothetical protein